MPEEQELVTLVSLRDDTGQAYLNTTRLVTDHGTIEFRSGQAKGVPADVAEALLEQRDDLYVQEWGLRGRDTAPGATPPSTPTAPATHGPIDDDPEAAAAALAQHLADEEAELGGDTPPGDAPPGDAPPGDTPPGDGEGDGDGEPDDPADPGDQQVKVVPQGFAAFTEDGSPRCLAAKADGTQCANVAKEGSSACGLQPHQDSVAQLPDAQAA